MTYLFLGALTIFAATLCFEALWMSTLPAAEAAAIPPTNHFVHEADAAISALASGGTARFYSTLSETQNWDG